MVFIVVSCWRCDLSLTKWCARERTTVTVATYSMYSSCKMRGKANKMGAFSRATRDLVLMYSTTRKTTKQTETWSNCHDDKVTENAEGSLTETWIRICLMNWPIRTNSQPICNFGMFHANSRKRTSTYKANPAVPTVSKRLGIVQ